MRTSQERHAVVVTLRRFGRVSPKLKEYATTNLLVCNTHIWQTKTENITTETHFVLMLKIGTFWMF